MSENLNNNTADVVEVDEVQKIDEAIEKSENFIENNKKIILIVVGVIVAIVLGVIWYFKGYKEPKNLTAAEKMYPAEQAFQQDSFNVALNGNAKVIGFLKIANEYGSTDAGNMAKAYAGICYKKLGDNANAIKFLEDYSSNKGTILSPAIEGAIGDCYWDLKKENEAISAFKKAIDSKDNLVAPIYLRRLGILYLNKEDKANAKIQFETLKNEYPESVQAQEVDKFIAMCE